MPGSGWRPSTARYDILEQLWTETALLIRVRKALSQAAHPGQHEKRCPGPPECRGEPPGRAMILPSNVLPPYTDCESVTSCPQWPPPDAAISGQDARETASRTLRSIDDTPRDLDICDTKALRVEH